MACKECSDKKPVPTSNNAAAQLELSRGRARNLLAGTEFGGSLSSKSSSADVIDALCAALVDAREQEKALSDALEKGSDCSAVEAELKDAESIVEELQKELEALHELCDGDHDEVDQDGVPQGNTVSEVRNEVRSRAAALSQVRSQEVRPSDSGGHAADGSAVQQAVVQRRRRPQPVRWR